MQKAVLTSPEVLSKWHAFRAAEGEADVVRGSLLPKLDVTVGVGREKLSQPATADLNYTRNGYTVTLNQMVYDGFTTINEVRRLGKAKLTRYFELLDAAENTALEAGKAYIDVMRYRFLLSLAEQNYVEHRAVYEQLLQRAQSGAGRRVDVEHAESRLALAEINVSTEQANLHDVMARYMRIVNEAPPKVMFGPALMGKNYPATVNDALRLAFAQNPTLHAAAENVDSAQYQLDGRRGAYQPRLDFRARSEHTGNYQGTPGVRTQQVAEFILSYNIFNGGADIARDRRYAEQRNVALDLRDKACRDIRQTLVIAYNDVRRLRSQLGFLGIQVTATEKSRDAYRAQFNIGQRSLLDLLDTENELLNARRTEVNAEMDLATAYLRTHAGIGQLLATQGLKHTESERQPAESELAAVSPGEICAALAPTVIETDNNAMTARALKRLDDMKPPAPAPMPGMPGLGAQAPTTVITSTEPGAATPTEAKAVEAKAAPSPEVLLHERLIAWAAAWSARAFATYQAHYAAGFVPENRLSREAWAKQRENRLTRPNRIQVELSDVQVAVAGETARTTFVQNYTSDTFSETSSKTLAWIREGGQWLIERESSVQAPPGRTDSKRTEGGR